MSDETRPRDPAQATPEPAWCIVANVLIDRPYGPGGAEIRHGTKHFAPGAKVHVFDFFWGMGGESVSVIGRHRKTKRYLVLNMRSAHLTNWRTELVYSPRVIAQIASSSQVVHWHPGSEEYHGRLEEIAASFAKGQPAQPFITRARREQPE
jgi:hypothetical protein